MNYRIINTLFLIIILNITSYTQNTSLRNHDFTAPVDIPIYLSGTFGELRSNHFHSGIDIKTQGVEGKNIRSIDEGWVSRIKISTGGYGKAIYITHPNGYVSVYGHLQKFNDSIQKIVVKKQYEVESFTTQLFFDKNELKVKKGEIIALSGNTGGSMGPHLHFEIRDEKSQHPINPLLFNELKIKDYYRPKITRLAIYPVDEHSMINGVNDTLYLNLSGWGLEHKIATNNNITVSGKVSFGISTYDLMNDIPNKNGVFSVILYHDTISVFDLEMNRLSFSTTRYINSLIDYSNYKKSKTRIIRTQVDTNNKLTNYKSVINNGIIVVDDTLSHNMEYVVKDAYGNVSKLSFSILGEKTNLNNKNINETNSPLGNRFFEYSNKNSIETDSLKVYFSSNSFYQSFLFDFEIIQKDSTSYSHIYKLHNQYTPVHKKFNISIKPDSIPSSIKDKIYIAYSTNNEKGYFFLGGGNENGFLKTKSRQLGYFKIMADTIPPEIKTVNFKEGKNISKQKTLKVKIKDKQTGIKTYRATLNNNWILMEYDAKKNLLTYNYDDRIEVGNNNFKIIVEDLLNNSTEYSCNISY